MKKAKCRNEIDIKRDMMEIYVKNRATISSGMSVKDAIFVRPDKNVAFLIDDNKVYRAMIEDNKIIDFKEMK